jgi:hypothetical protein
MEWIPLGDTARPDVRGWTPAAAAELIIGHTPMSSTRLQSRESFDELKPGDRIRVEHTVTVGQESWTARTVGCVIRTERRRHGLHFHRAQDDKVFSDVILLELPDGELTTVTMDEFTVVRRA